MSERRCGYCRSGNHRADKCEILKGQRYAIQRHQYGEKVALHQLMLRNGIGVGAILDFAHGDDKPQVHVIRSMKENFNHYNNNFLEYRPIKYQKSVRSVLKSYTGINHSPEQKDNDFVRWDHQLAFYVIASPMDNLRETNYGIIALCKLQHPPLDNPWHSEARNNYYAERSAKILSPSDETDIDEREYFSEPFIIHTRLGKDSRGYGIKVNPLP